MLLDSDCIYQSNEFNLKRVNTGLIHTWRHRNVKNRTTSKYKLLILLSSKLAFSKVGHVCRIKNIV